MPDRGARSSPAWDATRCLAGYVGPGGRSGGPAVANFRWSSAGLVPQRAGASAAACGARNGPGPRRDLAIRRIVKFSLVLDLVFGVLNLIVFEFIGRVLRELAPRPAGGPGPAATFRSPRSG